MRLAIAGIAGRMGRLLLEEARAAGHTVVGGTTFGDETPPDGLPALPIAQLAASADAVIDFTHRDNVVPHAAALAAAGTAWVLGTTGLSDDDDAAVTAAAARVAVVQSANFGPGINLLLALARQLGAALPPESYDAEIVETHHRQKVDAPSGTALALGRAVADGRGVPFDSVRSPAREGHTGPRRPGEIGFAALRGGQIVGEHTLTFTSAGEQITLAHRAIDRRAFAAGAVRAADWTRGRPPGRYTMAEILALP